MKKFNLFAGIMLAMSWLCISCDDNTGEIGSSLIDDLDHLIVSTDTFEVTTRSILADSVLSRSTVGYLGKVRDPETGAYLTSDFMTQFFAMEDMSMPEKDSIISVKDGNIVADSCDIRLYYTEFYGDSLAAMKLTAYEMSKPMSESQKYYSNFDPIANGYVDGQHMTVNKMYTLTDMNVSPSSRYSSDYMPSIRICLDKEYTDRDGNKYNNFGTYLLRKYYSNPEKFNNIYAFLQDVVPGFYFKVKSGLGSMAYVSLSQLNVYYRYTYKGTVSKTDGTEKDTVYVASDMMSFPGTEEVLQTSRMENDNNTLSRLVGDNSCSYIKTPAGIFTEVTLPVDEIVSKHTGDSINSAKVVFTRINDKNTYGDYSLSAPSTLLMIPKNELHSFFDQNKVADYKTSFLASYSSSANTYTFSNISNLIRHLASNADRTQSDWNKVVLVPVTTTYDAQSSLSKVSHDMSMSSTRLVGGSENPYSPIRISVVYGKFK